MFIYNNKTLKRNNFELKIATLPSMGYNSTFFFKSEWEFN